MTTPDPIAVAAQAIPYFGNSRTIAMAVVAALREAGHMLPEGEEQREECNVEYRPIHRTRGGVQERTYVNRSDQALSEEFEAAYELGMKVISRRDRTVTTWPDGSMFTGPWVEVKPGCSTCGGSGEVHCAAHIAGDGCDELTLACPDCRNVRPAPPWAARARVAITPNPSSTKEQ